MDPYIIVLRVLHIAAGVLWAGWVFSLVAFVQPALRAAGPGGNGFMQALVGKTRLVQVMLVAPLLVITTGLLMFWRASGGLSGAWFRSGPGFALTVGSLAGVLAFVSGLVINRPAGARMAALAKEVAAGGGPPSAAQAEELRALQGRTARGAFYGAVLLAVSVVGMSMARFSSF